MELCMEQPGGALMSWAARPIAASGDRADPGERELVRRAGRGDSDAFEALVRLHQDRIYGLALRMVGIDAAEEVAQRALIKAWRGLNAFDGRAAFGTWLYRIAINQCLDELRRRARDRPLSLDAIPGEPADHSDPAEEVADRDEGRARRAALGWALAQLRDEDRLILYLRSAEERSYEEIGALLGLNVRTVGTRLFRVRARLAALIDARLRGGP